MWALYCVCVMPPSGYTPNHRPSLLTRSKGTKPHFLIYCLFRIVFLLSLCYIIIYSCLGFLNFSCQHKSKQLAATTLPHTKQLLSSQGCLIHAKSIMKVTACMLQSCAYIVVSLIVRKYMYVRPVADPGGGTGPFGLGQVKMAATLPLISLTR